MQLTSVAPAAIKLHYQRRCRFDYLQDGGRAPSRIFQNLEFMARDLCRHAIEGQHLHALPFAYFQLLYCFILLTRLLRYVSVLFYFGKLLVS